MSSSNLDSTTLVVDDVDIHYDVGRDAAQSLAPSSNISQSVDLAKQDAWADSLTIITASKVLFWQNVTGFTRVAVYGSTIPAGPAGYTAWANYTIGGNYTVGNVSSTTNVITDYPLFVSDELDPAKEYNLTVDVLASPDTPYILDYILLYHDTHSTPIINVTTSLTSTVASSTSTPTHSESIIQEIESHKYLIGVIGGVSGLCLVLIVLVLYLLKRVCCGRDRKKKKTADAASDTEASMSEAPFPPRPTQVATVSSTKKTFNGEGPISLPSLSPTEPTFGVASVLYPTSIGSTPDFLVRSPSEILVSSPKAPEPRLAAGAGENSTTLRPMIHHDGSSWSGVSTTSLSGTASRTVAGSQVAWSAVQSVDQPLPNPYDGLIDAAALVPAFAHTPAAPPSAWSTQRSIVRTASSASTPSVQSSLPATVAPTTAAQSVTNISLAPVESSPPRMSSPAGTPSYVSVPDAPVATTSAAAQNTSQITTVVVHRSNEYPREKQEVRMEPPPQPQGQLHVLNEETHSERSGGAFVESPVDSPPAYGA